MRVSYQCLRPGEMQENDNGNTFYLVASKFFLAYASAYSMIIEDEVEAAFIKGPKENFMGFDNKLDSLLERKRDVERELVGLAEAKQQSRNTALSELENALMGELDQIHSKITQLHALIESNKDLDHTAH